MHYFEQDNHSNADFPPKIKLCV